LILAKLDRVFVSTDWEATYPLVRASCLAKGISDHTPILIYFGDTCSFGKKKIHFEKWWLQREDFGEIVQKVWSSPCNDMKALDR
jgi:hypothetical protein